MLKEFKEFAMRGNVIDMAVGVVMGAAFKAIVDSLVENIITPLIGLATAGIDFSDLKIVLKNAVIEGGEVVQPEVALSYGSVIDTIIKFIMISFCIFLMIKAINKMHRAPEAVEEAPAKSEEVLLLEEIRDALKK